MQEVGVLTDLESVGRLEIYNVLQILAVYHGFPLSPLLFNMHKAH